MKQHKFKKNRHEVKDQNWKYDISIKLSDFSSCCLMVVCAHPLNNDKSDCCTHTGTGIVLSRIWSLGVVGERWRKEAEHEENILQLQLFEWKSNIIPNNSLNICNSAAKFCTVAYNHKLWMKEFIRLQWWGGGGTDTNEVTRACLHIWMQTSVVSEENGLNITLRKLQSL